MSTHLRNIPCTILLALFIAGCSTTYTIRTVEQNTPVPFVDYRWHILKPRGPKEGSGQTDASGYATFKAPKHAKVYIRKGNYWGEQRLSGNSCHIVQLRSMEEYPMDLGAKIILGVEISEDEIPKHGEFSNQGIYGDRFYIIQPGSFPL